MLMVFSFSYFLGEPVGCLFHTNRQASLHGASQKAVPAVNSICLKESTTKRILYCLIGFMYSKNLQNNRL